MRQNAFFPGCIGRSVVSTTGLPLFAFCVHHQQYGYITHAWTNTRTHARVRACADLWLDCHAACCHDVAYGCSSSFERNGPQSPDYMTFDSLSSLIMNELYCIIYGISRIVSRFFSLTPFFHWLCGRLQAAGAVSARHSLYWFPWLRMQRRTY